MQNVSGDFQSAVSAQCRRINHSRVTIGSTVLTGEHIRSVSITEAVNEGEVMKPGCACSAQANVKIKYQSGVGYAGQQMTIERGIELEDGSIEYVLMGTFWITDPSSSDDYKTVDIVAQDAMVKLGGAYECKLSFPTTVSAMIQDVVSKAGLTLATSTGSFPDISIEEKPEGYSLREILGYLAGMCGKYAKATRDGKIAIEWYRSIGKGIQTEQIVMGGFKRLNDSPIRSRFSVYTDLGETLVSTAPPSDPDNPDAEDPADTDTNTDSEFSYLQDPREITGLNKWAIISDLMVCFSDDVTVTLDGTTVTATASQIYLSNNSRADHIYPVGWGGFEYLDSSAEFEISDLYAANFYKRTEDGTEIFSYTLGAVYIGDNFGVPSSGEAVNPSTRYSWDVGKYFTQCPFCSFDPTDESAYYDDTLVYCPLNMAALPKNWVLYYSPSDWTSNVELLDGTAKLVQGYFTLLYADEFWFTSGINDPDNDHMTFTLHSSFPRYWFRMGFPNDESDSKEWMWKFYKYDPSANTYTDSDNYRVPLWPNDPVRLQAYIRGDNAGFLFYTHVMASSCDIYNTPFYPSDIQVQLGYLPYGSHLVFPKSYEENLHSCNNQVIPDTPSTTDPEGNEIKYDSGATDYTNPLITADMLNTIQSNMPVTEYMPCNVQWRGNPAFEAGDVVTLTDRYGTVWSVPIMKQTFDFKGGLSATINAPGLTEEAAKFSASSSMDRSVRRVRADLKRQKATS